MLQVQNLCKQYPAFCLQDVSFEIESGRIMGLIGRNGAGKTTTLKAILRLIRPSGGTVLFQGVPLDETASALRRAAGYVSGDLCYYPRKKLSQLSCTTRAFYPEWDEARYQSLLQRFGLDESKRVCELSAGMKVKYQLACALSHGAKLLILDEPTSGLDPGADDVTYLQNGRVAASCALRAFTAPWLHVTGPAAALTPQLQPHLHGLRVHQDTFEALLPVSDAALAAGCRTKAPDLETVMVYLERGQSV